jgi:type 1 glutamine amidotransferase
MAEQNKKALLVWGGWDGHTPEQSVKIFIPFLEANGYKTTVSPTLDAYLDLEALRTTDLIVQCWTMGTITEPQRKNLLTAVSEGTGLAGWHGGIIDSFRNEVDYQFMTGGQWVAHPGGCIPAYDVKISAKEHPITRGIPDFTLKDTEQYYCHFDPAVEVLCTTVFDGLYGDRSQYRTGTVMPYAYTRGWGRGRVFVACWGHTFKDFEVPEALKIVQRGLLWASR